MVLRTEASPSPSPSPTSRFRAEIAAAGGGTTTRATTSTSTSGDSRVGLLGLTPEQAATTVLFGRKDIMDPYTGPSTVTMTKPRAPGVDDVPGRSWTQPAQIPGGEDSPWDLGDALLFFYDMSPQSREIVQAALYNKGLLPKKWANFGDDDDTSFAAWKKTLLRAQKNGQSVWQLLAGKPVTMTQFFNPEEEGGNQIGLARTALIASMSGGGGGRQRAPLQVELTNPEDLKQHARNAAVQTLGYTPDDNFLGEFVKLYQGMETGAQKKAYAGAGKVTRPPNPEVAAQEELRDEYETGSAGYGVVKAFQGLLSVMGVEG